MTSLLMVPGWAAALAALCIVGLAVAVALLATAVRRTRAETDRVLASAAADAEALRQELDSLEQRLAELSTERVPEVTVVDDREYVITGLGEGRSRGPLAAVPTVPAPVFVDIVLRESLIRTASLAAGLRRALAPDVRNRIRFEMKREVKRSRKQRRVLLREARRHLQARQRVEIDPA
jgi:hypothetical protein